MEIPKFFASSLKSSDCTISAELYAELFQGKILHSSERHSEVLFSETYLLVFSKESENCPVSPGTVVWRISERGKEKFLQKLEKVGFQKETIQANYSSYLDPWGNRNWIYLDSKKEL